MGGQPSADRPLYRPNPIFRVTMEKESEEETLGLSFEYDWTSKGIMVHHVREEGVIVRSNRANPKKMVLRGDIIMAVNGRLIRWRESWDEVRALFRQKKIRLTVLKGDMHEHYAKEELKPRMYCTLPSNLPTDLKACGCKSTECAICLEELERKGGSKRPLVVLPCGHAFHKDCALSWLRHSAGGSAPCPVCRSQMPGEKYEVIKGI